VRTMISGYDSKRRRRKAIVCATMCAAVLCAGAQENLSLRLTQAAPFREGELIPIEVEEPAPQLCIGVPVISSGKATLGL